MKKTTSFIILLLIFSQTFAQTKLIAHKSRGGSKATFKNALENDARLKSSNYGHAPTPLISNARLDSVIYVNDSVSIMVTSVDPALTDGYRLFVEPCAEYDAEGNLLPWNPGRDTLVHHEIFSGRGSITEMQNALDDRYFFSNKGKDVIFWNFPKRKKEQMNGLPVFVFNPGGPWTVLWLLITALFVLLLVKTKENQRRLV